MFSYNSYANLLDKQIATQQFILKHEGRFIYKAQHDGITSKTGKTIYTIGFGTRSYPGERITYEVGVHRFNKYLIDNVYPKLSDKLPKNKYIALGSAIYRTGVNIQDCNKIKRYVYVTVRDEKDKIKIKKVKSPVLIQRAQEEYKLCVGENNEKSNSVRTN